MEYKIRQLFYKYLIYNLKFDVFVTYKNLQSKIHHFIWGIAIPGFIKFEK